MQENLTNNFSTEFINNFWKRIEKTPTCWLWKGAKRTYFGYGEVRVEKKKAMAHRVAYAIQNGPIPEGLYVLHKCDNPICVNPEHLFLGTYKDNKIDSMNKKRHAFGEKNTHVLTEPQVREIRRLYLPRKRGFYKLSTMFNCSTSAIQAIVERRTWKHI